MLVLISVEMSPGATGNEMWQVWVTQHKVSWWTLFFFQDLWGRHRLVSKMKKKTLKFRVEHLSQDLWLFSGPLSWKEPPMGLSCVLTRYHHPNLHTVITFSLCSPWRGIQAICKIISKKVSISVHLTTDKAKHGFDFQSGFWVNIVTPLAPSITGIP